MECVLRWEINFSGVISNSGHFFTIDPGKASWPATVLWRLLCKNLTKAWYFWPVLVHVIRFILRAGGWLSPTDSLQMQEGMYRPLHGHQGCTQVHCLMCMLWSLLRSTLKCHYGLCHVLWMHWYKQLTINYT